MHKKMLTHLLFSIIFCTPFWVNAEPAVFTASTKATAITATTSTTATNVTTAMATAPTATAFAAVTPNPNLAFPRDHGAHPAFRTEWWYVTGQVQTASGKPFGFQVTFFRSRSGIGEDSKSQFAPSQILFAHAAIADPAWGKLRHDERAGRAGFGYAAKTDEMNIKLDHWTMKMEGDNIIAHIPARDFNLDLRMAITRQPLLQGDAGFSRKGPASSQASYYVSLPQLKVSGHIRINGKAEAVTGTAWFDHEWSSEYLASDAVGWDWLGANFDDGGALMAFQMRDLKGAILWAGGTRVLADGTILKLGREAVAFQANTTWKSPRTGALWPVGTTLKVGDEVFEIRPWFNDQELDSSRSTGVIYWEGAVDIVRNQQRLGRGYLELTGYAKSIKF